MNLSKSAGSTGKPRTPIGPAMICLVSAWLAACHLAAQTSADTQATPANLLPNCDFEQGEPGKMAAGWRIEAGRNSRPIVAQIDDRCARSGRRSLKIDTRPQDAASQAKPIPSIVPRAMLPVQAGRLYRFSCWIKADRPGVKGRLVILDGWDVPMPVFLSLHGKEVGFDPQWRQYSLDVKVPKTGDGKFFARRQGLSLRVDILSDGVVWIDAASFQAIEGSVFLNEGTKVLSRWRHIQSGDLIAEFTGLGNGSAWFKTTCPFSYDFCLTSGGTAYRASQWREPPIWSKVDYQMEYPSADPQTSCGDEPSAIRIYGNAKGLGLDYRASFGKDRLLHFDVRATPLGSGIRDFYWKIGLDYRSTPPESFVTLLQDGKRREVSLKGNIPALEVSRWLGFTVADNWTVDFHLDATGAACVPEGKGELRIYPVGLKPGAELEKGKTYTISLRAGLRELPFYGGPIAMKLKADCPFFNFPEPLALQASLAKDCGPLRARLIDALTEKVLDDRPLASPTIADGAAHYAWQYQPPAPGVYELTLSARGPQGEPLRKVCELVSIGKIAQRTIPVETRPRDAFQLELVDRIECAAAEDRHPLLDGVTKSTVVASPLGAYREAGSRHGDCLIWEFKVKELHQPHLVVVEYPDDKPRTISFCVTEPPSIPRVSNGAICGEPYPPTNRFQEMDTLYYPTHATAYLVMLTCEQDHPAAARRVSVYRILDDLPAVELKNKATGRWIGVHTESENTQWVSYTSKSRVPVARAGSFDWTDIKSTCFYREWYRTIANQVKDMRLSGQNLFVTGAFRYDSALFPGCSEHYTKYGYHALDYYELMARMFQANDLGLILSLEFLNTPRLIAAGHKHSYQEVLDGARTVGQVSRGGQLASAFGGVAPNPFAPEVQNAMVKVAGELASRYGKHASVLGLAFLCGDEGFQPCLLRKFVPGEDNLEYSYDDISIERFEKEEKIKIPVDRKAQDRFAKRYEWLMSHAREAWIQWRCEAMRDLLLKINEKVYSQGLECYFMDVRSVMDVYSERRWRTAGVPYRDLLRERGFDPLLFRGTPGLVFGNLYKQNEGRYYVHRGAALTSEHRPTNGVIREFNLAPDVREAYQNGTHTAGFIHNQFYEVYFPFGREFTWRELLIPNHWTGTDYSWPTRPYFGDPFVTMLAQGDLPRVIMHSFCDNEAWVGSHDQMRRFALALRTLPLGDYRILTGDRSDPNVIVREAHITPRNSDAAGDGHRPKVARLSPVSREQNICEADATLLGSDGGDTYLMVINPCWWSADCTLTLSRPAPALDLVADHPIPAGAPLAVALGPYDVKTFKVQGRASVSAVRTTVSDAGIRELERRIRAIDQAIVRLESQASPPPKELAIASSGLAKARQCLARGDFYAALRHVDGFAIKEALDCKAGGR